MGNILRAMQSLKSVIKIARNLQNKKKFSFKLGFKLGNTI